MSVTAQELLLHAKEMSQQNREIDWRACVNRAYYAVYHKALTVAQDKGYVSTRTHSVHTDLIHYIKEFDSKLAQRINALRKKRATVDYDVEGEIKKIFAQQAVSEGERLMHILDKQ